MAGVGFQDALDLITASIATNVATDLSTTSFVYPNAPFSEVDADSEFVRVTMLDGETTQADLSATPRWKHTGVLIFQVFVKAETGEGRAREIADTIAGWYRGTSVGKLVFRAASARNVGIRNGWYQYNIELPFYFHEIYS